MIKQLTEMEAWRFLELVWKITAHSGAQTSYVARINGHGAMGLCKCVSELYNAEAIDRATQSLMYLAIGRRNSVNNFSGFIWHIGCREGARARRRFCAEQVQRLLREESSKCSTPTIPAPVAVTKRRESAAVSSSRKPQRRRRS